MVILCIGIYKFISF